MVKRSAAMLNVTWRRRSAYGEPDLTMLPGSLNTYEEVAHPMRKDHAYYGRNPCPENR